MDLAKPEWKGRYGVAAAGANFQAIVSAALALKGPDQTDGPGPPSSVWL
jgi:iron(III) transport system substrate-binding protein